MVLTQFQYWEYFNCKLYEIPYVWTVEKDMKTWLIIAVLYTSKAVVKFKSEKNSCPNGIQTNDLCNTGAVHYQTNYQANWELVTLSVHNNTVHVKESNEYLKDHIIFKLWRKIWRHDHCSYKQSLKCHYDQIIDIHFFTFLYTVNLFSRSRQISIYYEH